MKNKILLWQLIGFTFVSVLGTFLHFLYEWSGGNVIIATISGVNESTWEHMKLLFFPLALFIFIEKRHIDSKNFFFIKLCGIIIGLILIPILFYTLNGAFGKTPDWLNISIFYISAAVVFAVEYYLFKRLKRDLGLNVLSVIAIFVTAISFVLFTFYPPEIPLFLDPITKGYGIQLSN